jgi:hypothetical protein
MRVVLLVIALAVAPTALAEPFSLKDDVLGESLDAWRAKHRHVASTYQGNDEYAPMCSDTSPRNTTIKPTRTQSGQVNCELYYPYQQKVVTIANVAADIQFTFNTSTDGHEAGNGLWRIHARFDSGDFRQVKDAMVARWGQPQQSNTERLQNAFGAVFEGERLVWDNDESQMMLTEFAGSRDRSSLRLLHKALYSEYEKRGENVPNPNAGDL